MLYWVSLCLFFLLTILGILSVIRSYGRQYILEIEKLPRDCDVVIVLGAGVRPDGNPCDLLADRIDTGVKIYLAGFCRSILLTGDNSGEHYNEVAVMKNWIMKRDVENAIDEHKILIDNYGLCTYDSMYRAKYLFNVNKVIISTNRYHLPRAIYIARKMGIEAYGVASDLRTYDRMKKYIRREILAQIKDFILVNIWGK
jgi:vancomycin permeability regulator SanA